MASADMWRKVGEQLALLRVKKGWLSIDVQRAGGPHYSVVTKNERGSIGHIDSVNRHCDALGTDLGDILKIVLLRDLKENPLSLDQARLVARYAAASPGGQKALLTMAEQLAPPVAAPAPAPTSIKPSRAERSASTARTEPPDLPVAATARNSRQR